MNILQVDLNGKTPESKIYGVQLDNIPIKYFHTLFFPVYVLDLASRALYEQVHRSGSQGLVLEFNLDITHAMLGA